MKVSDLRSMFENSKQQIMGPTSRPGSFNMSPKSSFIANTSRTSQEVVSPSVVGPKSPRRDTSVPSFEQLTKDVGYVLYDFHAEGKDELSVKAGDVVKIIIRERDWSWCQLGSNEGNIPTLYYSLDKPQEKPEVILAPFRTSPLPVFESNVDSPLPSGHTRSLVFPRKSPKTRETIIKPQTGSFLLKSEEPKDEVKVEAQVVVLAPIVEKGELPPLPDFPEVNEMTTSLSVAVPVLSPNRDFGVDPPKIAPLDEMSNLRLRIVLLESEIFSLMEKEEYLKREKTKTTKNQTMNHMEAVKKQLLVYPFGKNPKKVRSKTILLEQPSSWKNSNGIHWISPNSTEFAPLLPIFKGNFLIETINRIENSKVFGRYRSRIEKVYSKTCLVPKVEIDMIPASSNEFYMLYFSHMILDCASYGFDVSAKVNGPLGCGFYLFDSIQGISEMLNRSKTLLPPEESISILVCRVAFGAIKVCQDVTWRSQGFESQEWPDAIYYSQPKSRFTVWNDYAGDIPGTFENYDSIFHQHVDGITKEVIVFHPDQIYPEFMVEGHILRE